MAWVWGFNFLLTLSGFWGDPSQPESPTAINLEGLIRV